jgi:hypothetical protein
MESLIPLVLWIVRNIDWVRGRSSKLLLWYNLLVHFAEVPRVRCMIQMGPVMPTALWLFVAAPRW